MSFLPASSFLQPFISFLLSSGVRVRVVFDIKIDPYGTCDPEKPYEQYNHGSQHGKKSGLPGGAKYKDENATKNKCVPPRNNIRNEHSPVIKPWTQKIFLPAFRAVFGHIERFLERKRTCLEKVAFLATGAFHV